MGEYGMKLEELKKQNEEEEKKLEEPADDLDEEVVEDSEDEQEEVEDLEEEESEDDEKEQKTLEPWQMSDEDEAAISKGEEEKVPVKTHLKIKSKLKGRLSDAEKENKRLKEENERLQSLKTDEPKLKKPLPEDFKTDDEYEAALDKYEDAVATQRYYKIAETERKTTAQKKAIEARQQSVEKHYERAAELVESSGIKPELFKNADTKFRSAIDSIVPGSGDVLADHFIDLLGEGSEKVIYYLGVNEAGRNKFQALFSSEPQSGMKAAVYLGQLKQKLLKPAKMTSNAPAPATRHNGDDKPGSGSDKKRAKALKKEYKNAAKSGNPQDIYNARKEARKLGIDVSDW
jgi:chromosome segregation ATPase